MGIWDNEDGGDEFSLDFPFEELSPAPPTRTTRTKTKKKFEDDDLPVYIPDYYEAVPHAADLVELIEPDTSRYARGLLPEQKVFLAHYMASGVVTTALRKSGLSHKRYKEYMANDEVFGQAVEAATEAVADVVEQEALKRALLGSDKLLIKMLESLRPQKFGRQSTTFWEGRMDVRVQNWGDLAKQALVIDAESVPVQELKEVTDSE